MAPDGRPGFLAGEIRRRVCDGVSDDLLTAGLGLSGLTGPPPPADPPTVDNLRRRAFYTNYRGLLDVTPGGGFGRFFGPGVGPDGQPSGGEGRIAGREYLALADDGTGRKMITLMVQIPEGFDPDRPCIVAAASSGSRGIYGAVPVAGDWALKRGHVLAATDKGTGNAVHDLSAGTVGEITGPRIPAAEAEGLSPFVAPTDPAYIRENPGRIAFKHAHSGENPEADWGRDLLWAVRFAFYVLNLPENFGAGSGIRRERTRVIATGISNGGGAALRAVEMDTDGLIDGAAVSEPNIYPGEIPGMSIRQGDRTWSGSAAGRPLLDYSTWINLLQPCADLAPETRPFAGDFPPGAVAWREARCRRLARMGLLSGETAGEQGASAQRRLNDAGILAEQNFLGPVHWEMGVSEGISVTYANAYGRFRPDETVCGLSFAPIDPETKAPRPLGGDEAARLFGDGNGIPPTGGIEIIDDRSAGGPVRSRDSRPAAGEPDGNLDAALCLRRLATGLTEAGESLAGPEGDRSRRVRRGIEAVRATGDLRGRPVLVVHGRNDAILPPNHTIRPYAVLNHRKEGDRSRLRYYEVTHAHHLDAVNAVPGFDAAQVPLHVYLLRILDLLDDHLENGTALPSSQVVRPIPRGRSDAGAVPPIESRNLPPVAPAPAQGDAIEIDGLNIRIPE